MPTAGARNGRNHPYLGGCLVGASSHDRSPDRGPHSWTAPVQQRETERQATHKALFLIATTADGVQHSRPCERVDTLEIVLHRPSTLAEVLGDLGFFVRACASQGPDACDRPVGQRPGARARTVRVRLPCESPPGPRPRTSRLRRLSSSIIALRVVVRSHAYDSPRVRAEQRPATPRSQAVCRTWVMLHASTEPTGSIPVLLRVTSAPLFAREVLRAREACGSLYEASALKPAFDSFEGIW